MSKVYNPPISGYKTMTEFAPWIDEDDLETGYCDCGELDLSDIFGPFDMPNYGLPGGACTVDDFTPEGVMDAPYSRKQTSVGKLHIEETPADESSEDKDKRYP